MDCGLAVDVERIEVHARLDNERKRRERVFFGCRHADRRRSGIHALPAAAGCNHRHRRQIGLRQVRICTAVEQHSHQRCVAALCRARERGRAVT